MSMATREEHYDTSAAESGRVWARAGEIALMGALM